MQWGKLFVQTAQLSGRVLFIEDQAPSDLSLWCQGLPEKIPWLSLSVRELLTGTFLTRSEDLVVFFPSQETVLRGLHAVLAGQRLALGFSPPPSYCDHACPQMNISEWQKEMVRIKEFLDQASPVAAFPQAFKTPCLFLDRDDVVVKNVPYNKDPARVELMEGIETLISAAHDRDFWVALVTNQSGLGRGRIDWGEYQRVHQRMLNLLAEKGVWIDEALWATFIENGAGEASGYYPSLRKPRGGMFLEVHRKLKPDLKKSVMVGDSASDLIAAASVGIPRLFLLKTEKTLTESRLLDQGDLKGRYHVCDRLTDVTI